MKRLSTSSVMLALWMVVSSGRLWAQPAAGDAPEGSPAQAAAVQAAAEPATDAPVASQPRSRAPRFYGQLNLSDDQRSAIDAIQQKYQSQLADLQRQLDELRDSRDKDTRATLQPQQQQKLAELIRKDRERRSQQVTARHGAPPRTPAAATPRATAAPATAPPVTSASTGQ